MCFHVPLLVHCDHELRCAAVIIGCLTDFGVRPLWPAWFVPPLSRAEGCFEPVYVCIQLCVGGWPASEQRAGLC